MDGIVVGIEGILGSELVDGNGGSVTFGIVGMVGILGNGGSALGCGRVGILVGKGGTLLG